MRARDAEVCACTWVLLTEQDALQAFQVSILTTIGDGFAAAALEQQPRKVLGARVRQQLREHWDREFLLAMKKKAPAVRCGGDGGDRGKRVQVTNPEDTVDLLKEVDKDTLFLPVGPSAFATLNTPKGKDSKEKLKKGNRELNISVEIKARSIVLRRKLGSKLLMLPRCVKVNPELDEYEGEGEWILTGLLHSGAHAGPFVAHTIRTT